MLEVAEGKYPDKTFILAHAGDTNFPDQSFHLVFANHLLYHLDNELVGEIFDEMHRILLPGGRFIFDVASAKRRNMFRGHHYQNWHGSNPYSMAELGEAFEGKWEIIQHQGVLFVPIHRIYSPIRPYFSRIDKFLCRIFASDYSSYMMVVME
jgi:ubiquinone/menaquinone biosynthesis C-methylase UbiE